MIRSDCQVRGERWPCRSYLDAGLPDGGQFVLENMHELTLTDTVPVDDDPVRFVASGGLVEHHQVLLHLKDICVSCWCRVEEILTIAERSWMISCLCCWTRTVAAYLGRMVVLLSLQWWRANGQTRKQTCLGERLGFPQLQQCSAFYCPQPEGGSRLLQGKSPAQGKVWHQNHGTGHRRVICRFVESTHRFVENLWSDGWNQNGVHSSQFHIDLNIRYKNIGKISVSQDIRILAKYKII